MVVIPFDGTKIAVSKEGDFLRDTIVKDKLLGHNTIDDMFGCITATFARLQILPDTKGQFTNYNLLESKLSKVSSSELLLHLLLELCDNIDLIDDIYDIIESYDADKIKAQKFDDYLKSGKCDDKNINNIFKRLESNPNNKFATMTAELFSPSILGLTIGQIGQKLPNGVECWVSGKAILLEFKTFLTIIDQLKKSEFPVHSKYKNLME